MPSASRLLATEGDTAFKIETKRRRALFKRELSLRKKRSHAFTRHYHDIVDLIGDPLRWPERICAVRCVGTAQRRHTAPTDDFRRLLIAPNLKHAPRFKLTLFLLSNGIPPQMILDFYQANGSLRDISAQRSVESLTKSYCASKMPTTFVSFDLTRGRWEDMNGVALRCDYKS